MPAQTVIQLRTGTAAQWTAANPTLAMGEMGYESDTGQLKIGNGTTAWSSLAYGGPQGPAQTQVIESYGDGSDGNVLISSGTTTLVRDMFYNNLTLSGTGQIVTGGYRVFVKGILDITAAQAGAIINNGGNGGNASSQTGGSAGTATTAATVGAGGAAGAGGTGVVGAGVEPASATGGQNGGSSNAAGASGAGGPNSGPTGGGASRAGSTVAGTLPIRRYEVDLLKGITLITGGAGAPGGSAGSGDGTTVGNSCGGGGGGAGGGILPIWANTLNRASTTPTSCIQAMGGYGGNGRNGQGTYTFTIPAGSTASIGTVYTNNGQSFIVTTTLIGTATSVITYGTGVPTTTGTLTLSSGTGSSSITYTAVAATSSAAAVTAGVGGGGGGSGGGGGWIFLQYANLTNTFTFTISSSTVSQNAVYSNNGQTFVVSASISSGTTLTTAGTGLPTSSGTLTLVSGTGPTTISFSAYSGTVQTATNCLDTSGGNGGVGGNGANNHTFTITSGQTASVGATFTNNGYTFTVTTTLTSGQTTLVTVGTGIPSASGTLTKATGTSSGNITFSTFINGTTAAGGNGGSGGNGGRITLLQVPTSTGSETFTGTGNSGGAASGIFGGNIGAGATNQVSL